MELHNFIADLALEFKQGENSKDVVFFIDTNPALSIYTQIALVAMTQLIIPVVANSFSTQVRVLTSQHVQTVKDISLAACLPT